MRWRETTGWRRQALKSFDDSRIPAGLTQSRYPTSQPQIIPTFSLIWIDMLHDYWMYRPDASPVKAGLPGSRTVLDWFAQYEQPDGLLRKLPWWSFVDWVSSGELPTYDEHGESCTTTLHYLGALGDAAELERALGEQDRADRESRRAEHVRSGLYEKCWDAGRKLLADNPAHNAFSQQTNVLGVLYDVIPRAEQQGVLRQVMGIDPGTTSSGGILSSSYYFRFYLARALDHAGMADEYLASLEAVARFASLAFQYLAGDAGEDAVRFACMERASRVRFADAGGRDRAGVAGVCLGSDCSSFGGFAGGVGGISTSSRDDQGALRARW